MKKVTFPHMGTSVVVFADLIRDLGNETVVPIRPNKRILDLGVRYGPEFACLPFKILLGSYLEAVERGADTVVTSGGSGPCRAGHYGEVAQKIMASAGKDLEFIVFDSIYQKPLEFIRKVNRLNSSKLSYWTIVQLVRFYWRKLQALDQLERASHRVRPRELKRGEATQVFNESVKWVQESKTMGQIAEAEASGLKAFNAIAQNSEVDVVKVGIVGEIYVVLEPAANLEIEETLGNMGVEVNRSIYLTGWTRENTPGGKKSDGFEDAAKPYLPEPIGGHAQESIGHTVMFARDGYDGVIQLAPFTCIPEIVVKTIMPRVTREHGIPVLTFFLDEQTGKAGMQTRLEAFIDMLRRKKETREEMQYARVSGH